MLDDAGSGGAAIEFDHVWFGYPPSGADAPPAPVLEDISLRVEAGERLGVLGPNGGGKTTLLKLALGLLSPTRGRVLVQNADPCAARRAGRIGFVAQRCTAELAFPLSARQAVELGAWRRPRREATSTAAQALELVGAQDLGDRPVGKLSGGQLQRVLIARALAGGARILLLDEPTVGIDVVGQQVFAKLLARLHDQLRLTIVVVSHDVRAIAAGCDRIACLSRRLHSHTSPEGLTPAVLAEVFEHDVTAFFGDVHVHAHAAAECPEHDDRPRGRATPPPDPGGARRVGGDPLESPAPSPPESGRGSG